MVVRAYKHILQAFVAAVDNVADLAASIASCLNLLLGTPSSENPDADIVILRGLCHKVNSMIRLSHYCLYYVKMHIYFSPALNAYKIIPSKNRNLEVSVE
jgi:hypothetical protein